MNQKISSTSAPKNKELMYMMKMRVNTNLVDCSLPSPSKILLYPIWLYTLT